MINKAAKIILVNPKNKKVLLYLRDDKSSLPFSGYWDLFGGTIEKKESALEAVEREVREEISALISEIKPLGKMLVKGDPLSTGDYEIFLFWGKVNVLANKIKLNEGKKLKYFKLNELSKIKFPYFYRGFIIQNRKILGI